MTILRSLFNRITLRTILHLRSLSYDHFSLCYTTISVPYYFKILRQFSGSYSGLCYMISFTLRYNVNIHNNALFSRLLVLNLHEAVETGNLEQNHAIVIYKRISSISLFC